MGWFSGSSKKKSTSKAKRSITLTRSGDGNLGISVENTITNGSKNRTKDPKRSDRHHTTRRTSHSKSTIPGGRGGGAEYRYVRPASLPLREESHHNRGPYTTPNRPIYMNVEPEVERGIGNVETWLGGMSLDDGASYAQQEPVASPKKSRRKRSQSPSVMNEREPEQERVRSSRDKRSSHAFEEPQIVEPEIIVTEDPEPRRARSRHRGPEKSSYQPGEDLYEGETRSGSRRARTHSVRERNGSRHREQRPLSPEPPYRSYSNRPPSERSKSSNRRSYQEEPHSPAPKPRRGGAPPNTRYNKQDRWQPGKQRDKSPGYIDPGDGRRPEERRGNWQGYIPPEVPMPPTVNPMTEDWYGDHSPYYR